MLLHLLRHWFTPHHTNNQRARLLHPTGVSLVIGVFTLLQLGLTLTSHRFPQILGLAASVITPEEIVSLTNIERQSHALPPVKLDDQLSRAAAQKASDMFARDYWAHISPVGIQPWHFITLNNYSYRYAGENLARDFREPQAVVKAWLASPSHRENLLNDKYQDTGVAVVDGQLGGRPTTLVVQMFGTKLTAAANPPPQPVALSAVPSITVLSPTFAFTKYLSILLLGTFVAVLMIDVITVYRRQIARWTSKSFAHLTFVTILLVAVTLLSAGQII